MSYKQKTVVADADVIVALSNIDDANHKKAVTVSKKLESSRVKVVYPVTAVAEAVTVMQTKMNSLATARGTADLFTNPDYQVVDVDQNIYASAVKNYYSTVTNKRDTIFDCIIAAVAKDKKADAIFSFDKFYKKRGFKLASEL